MRRIVTGFLLLLLCGIVACNTEHTRTDSAANDTAAAESTPPSVYPDSRITRFTSLLGKSKETIVQTLGPPTNFEHLSRVFVYRGNGYTTFMQFYDPERAESLFNSQTRGGAATLTSLSHRFEGKPPIAVVLKSLNAPEKPDYMLVGKAQIAWFLKNIPNNDHWNVGYGGIQSDGYAYTVFATCSVPPLTGTPTFNYQTNLTEVTTLTPNRAFEWSRCTPTSLRMNARADFTGYSLGQYDAQELVDRVALDGSALAAQ